MIGENLQCFQQKDLAGIPYLTKQRNFKKVVPVFRI